MSRGNSTQRLFRAVRLLPEAVRIGGLPGGKTPDKTGVPSDVPVVPEDLRDRELRSALEQLEGYRLELEDAQSALRSAALREAEFERTLEALRQQASRREQQLREALDQDLARQESDARTRGHEEGYQRGYAEGRDQALREVEATYRARFSHVVQLLEGVHEELQEHLGQLSELAQPRLVRLWAQVLEKLLMREVRLNEATAMTLLQQVLLRVSNRERLVVYLNPGDLGTLQENQSELGEVLRGVRHLEFVADGQVDPGSCLVETNLGVYDARWRTQLEQVDREIDAALLEEADENDENHQ